MRRVSEHLFWLEDTCSAYAVTAGDGTLLIDCGTDIRPGANQLAGLPPVELVVLTHFHRDQCASAAEWRRQGAQVLIPFAERRFFEEADLQRAAYDTYNSYVSYYPCFAPLEDVRPAEYVYDYARFSWRGLQFQALPLPGHTFGSTGYLFELDGARILACGDLLSAPGKLRDYYWAQWTYMDFTGHANYMESLKTVESLQPTLILPGHGKPFPPSAASMAELRAAFEETYALFYGRPYAYFQPQFRHITPHLVEVSNTWARTYLAHDDAGHALCIDCGYAATNPIQRNPHRFVDGLTAGLARELGIHAVEWFLCSHYHDDHLAGYPTLRRLYGTRFASSPELQDILEHPERYEMPCLMAEACPVDAVIPRGEAWEWRGIRFFMEQHPGQTIYHHTIWFEVDGKKFLCAGDNISGLAFAENRDFIYSFIPKNRTPVSAYGDIVRRMLELAPDYILPGHGPATAFDVSDMQRWRAWMERWTRAFGRMLDQDSPDRGMDPRWVEFYPYKVRVRPGETVRFRVNVTNHDAHVGVCRLRFRSVAGVELAPAEARLAVPAQGIAQCELVARFPSQFQSHSLMITADVTWNDHHLGEIAEAVPFW